MFPLYIRVLTIMTFWNSRRQQWGRGWWRQWDVWYNAKNADNRHSRKTSAIITRGSRDGSGVTVEVRVLVPIELVWRQDVRLGFVVVVVLPYEYFLQLLTTYYYFRLTTYSLHLHSLPCIGRGLFRDCDSKVCTMFFHHVPMSASIRIYALPCIHAYTYLCITMYPCLHLYVSISVFVCLFPCTCPCFHIYIHIDICADVNTNALCI